MIRLIALALAVVSTSTAVCMSVLAGWQRGGWLSERLVWIALGIVLVSGAHLLPALCRSAPPAVRRTGVLLWCGCMAAASFGHATFFLMSQSHAGDIRVAALPVIDALPHRSLIAVMADRASVTAQLARDNARRCFSDCQVLRGRRAGLAAQLDALDAEAADIRRDQTIEDRAETSREAVRTDPVTGRLAALFGSAGTKLDLLAGLVFAAVLEGMACLLWWIALLPARDATPATAILSAAPVAPPVPEPLAIFEPETEITKLIRDVQAGLVKPTVSGIRRHLRCSQAKAAVLRRQIDEHNTMA
ncbi:hypothetical protein [Burkholderia sp. 22PA0106]|uniref:hypothetical protein n=1 Tax=Burkholderia sp. 22PA0106 TaxID=3237371 RepID=UPI0039C1CECE